MKKNILYTLITLTIAFVVGVVFSDLLAGIGGGVTVAMALTGYTRTCGLQSGGGMKIWLTEVASLTSMTVTGDVYTAITMEGANVFVLHEFEPDSFELKETTTIENGSIKVTHEIEFFLKKLDDTARVAIEEIVLASACGLVAIVEDNNATKWVVGYNETHGKLRPLSVSTVEGLTGKNLSDAAGNTVKLVSEDNEHMRTVTAVVPV